MNQERKSNYERNDGYNPSVDCSNPIKEEWIHKSVVKITGEGEDDFIIEQKAQKINEINIQKSIQEEAKTTDLKYLLKQLLMTGDESIINKKPGFFGDVSSIQSHMENGSSIVSPEDIKKNLPEELQQLSVEELATMSDKDIIKYFEEVRAKQNHEENKPEVKLELKPEEQQPEVKGD